MLHRLRAATALHHAAIEKRVHLLDDAVTLNTYKAYLERTFGFYATVEPIIAIAASRLHVWGVDTHARRRLPLFYRDFAALDVPHETLPVCDNVPPLTTLAQLFGCLYVLEGSTLGGQIIAASLRKTGVGGDHNGFHTLVGYGAKTGSMWRALTQALVSYVASHPETEPQLIASAQATFASFNAWLARDLL